MDIQLINHDGDVGTLEIIFGKDDYVDVSGYGDRIVLKVPLYANEAADVIEAITPLANTPDNG